MSGRFIPRAYLLTAASALAGSLVFLSACSQGEAAADASAAPRVVAATPEEAGRYLVFAGSCDDCHTPGWPQTGGNVPDSQRLVGSPVGYRGPWGVSYAANLRLSASQLDADDWVAMVRARDGLPPMPWISLHRLTDEDLSAIHTYLVSLGEAGEPAPTALPPGVEPTTIVVDFSPVMPKGATADGR